MSASRFVSSDPSSKSEDRDAAWAQAQKAVDAAKAEQNQSGRQEGGKSLYEVLQQNKAAKQEAFEESIKLKNQFKALEEDEVEFLDSVLEAEREKIETVQRETRAQLETFREQQRKADQQQDDLETGAAQSPVAPAGQPMWTARKKRKRPNDTEITPGTKARKPSASGTNGVVIAAGSRQSQEASKAEASNQEISSSTPSSKEQNTKYNRQSPAKPGGLGLIAYEDSDED